MAFLPNVACWHFHTVYNALVISSERMFFFADDNTPQATTKKLF